MDKYRAAVLSKQDVYAVNIFKSVHYMCFSESFLKNERTTRITH
jgi:hypothetical protein